MGFINAGQSAPYSIIPDYTLPFLGETAFSTITAGVIGVFVVGAIIMLVGRGLKAKA
jgi:cobalt/nickel transport system permease protein